MVGYIRKNLQTSPIANFLGGRVSNSILHFIVKPISCIRSIATKSSTMVSTVVPPCPESGIDVANKAVKGTVDERDEKECNRSRATEFDLGDESLLGCAGKLETYIHSVEISEKERRSVKLPTLEETSCFSKEAALTDNKNVLPSVKEDKDVQSREREARKSPKGGEASALDHKAVNDLKDKASLFALRGSEDKALRSYKKALRLTRKEVARIKRQLQLAGTKPQKLRQTIHILLHDEWAEVALVIAEIRTMMAIIHERVADYGKAIECCKEARDIYDRQVAFEQEHNTEESMYVSNVEQMAHMMNKMEIARDTFPVRRKLHVESLSIQEQIKVTKDPAVKDLLFKKIFNKLSSLLSVELDSLGESHPQVADTMGFFSQIYAEKQEMDKALDAMDRAVTIAELSLGVLHPRTGEKYRELARIYEGLCRDDGDTEIAILYFEKAINTFKGSYGDHSGVIGSILNDVGVLHIQREELDDAVHKLSDALASYDSSVEKCDGICADTVQVWRNLAECYVLRKEWESAAMAFASALEVQRDAKTFHERTTTKDGTSLPVPALASDESIGDTLKKLAKVCTSQARYDLAVLWLTEALMIHQTSFDNAQENAVGGPTLELADKQDQIAHTLYCIAEVKEMDGNHDEAATLYDEALQLRKFSDSQRPNTKKVNRVHCAMCLAGIGSVKMQMKRFSDAFKVYNEALQFCKAQNLPKEHPIFQMVWEKSRIAGERMAECIEEPGRRRSVESSRTESRMRSDEPEVTRPWFCTASKVERKALAQEKKGNFDGAIESSLVALELRRTYLTKREESKRDTSKAKHHIARSLVNLARLMVKNGKKREAEDNFKEAIELYVSSGTVSRNHTCVREIEAEVERLSIKK
jgi:tetratricopeptide (TPR) repeat protein